MHLKRDLEIVVWNAFGLAARHAELVEFAARNKPDMLLLGKTRLTSSKRFRLSKYVFYRNFTAGDAGGGIVIEVKTSIRQHRWLQPTDLQ